MMFNEFYNRSLYGILNVLNSYAAVMLHDNLSYIITASVCLSVCLSHDCMPNFTPIDAGVRACQPPKKLNFTKFWNIIAQGIRCYGHIPCVILTKFS